MKKHLSIMLVNVTAGIFAGLLVGAAEIIVTEIRTRRQAQEVVTEATETANAAGTLGE